MTQNDKQEWKKLFIYSIQLVRVYILYAIYVYREIYYAALWQCLMMEQKMQNNMERARKSVLGVSLDPDKAATTTRTTTACHKGHQSF